MKNKLISMLAVPLVLTGLVGCYGAPIIKEELIEPAPSRNVRIEYIPNSGQEKKDCIGLIIKLYDTDSELTRLTKMEKYAIEELKRNPNSYLDEKLLKLTLEDKKKIMNSKTGIMKEMKDYKCLGY